MNKIIQHEAQLNLTCKQVIFSVDWSPEDAAWVAESTNTTMPIAFHVDSLQELHEECIKTVDEIIEMLAEEKMELRFISSNHDYANH